METHETQGDCWGLVRLSETNGDSETQGDYLGLIILMILIKTKGD